MVKPNRKIILLFLGRIVQSALAVVSIRMLTSFLSPQEVGHQYVINSIALWFSLVLINPVGMYVNRHLHEWKEKKQLHSFLNQLNWYFAAVAVLSLPVVFLLRHFVQIGEFLPHWELLSFILIYIFFSTWFQTFVSLFNLFDLQKIFVSLNILAQLTGLIFAVLAVKTVEATAIAWLAGLLLGQMLAFAVSVLLFVRKFPKAEHSLQAQREEGIFSRNTLNFCYPIAITTLFMWFLSQGYRLIVERNLGAESLAAIGVGLGLATSLANVVESLATQYFYPGFYASIANSSLEQRRSAWEVLWKKTLIVYLPFCFLVVAVSPLVVRVLTAQSFHHIVSFLWFGAVIELFRQLSNIAYLVSHAEKKTHNTILPYLLGAGFLAAFVGVAIWRNFLSVHSVLLALCFAGLITYICNLVTVKRLLSAQLSVPLIVFSALISLPMLASAPFLSVESDLLVLIAAAGMCGFWYLGAVYFLLKKFT